MERNAIFVEKCDVMRNCWNKKFDDGDIVNRNDSRKYYKCGKEGHIARYCNEKSEEPETEDEDNAMMYQVAMMTSLMDTGFRKC